MSRQMRDTLILSGAIFALALVGATMVGGVIAGFEGRVFGAGAVIFVTAVLLLGAQLRQSVRDDE